MGARMTLPVRLAALVIAWGGSARFASLRFLARHHGFSGRAVAAAVETLAGDRLVCVDGDRVQAVDVAELAAWVADELDADGGY